MLYMLATCSPVAEQTICPNAQPTGIGQDQGQARPGRNKLIEQ